MDARKKAGAKGQSQVVTNSLFVLFSVVLIIIVASSMNKVENDLQNFTGNMQAGDICSIIKNAAEKIYAPVGSNVSMNATEEMGYSVIDLPQKLGNDYYSILFTGNSVEITAKDISRTCEIGINATLSGLSRGGRTKIKWLYGNGTNAISIENA